MLFPTLTRGRVMFYSNPHGRGAKTANVDVDITKYPRNPPPIAGCRTARAISGNDRRKHFVTGKRQARFIPVPPDVSKRYLCEGNAPIDHLGYGHDLEVPW